MSEENITNKQPLIRYVNRQQMSWRAVDVEKLISEDHPARAIWTLVGRLDLSPFYRAIESSVEEDGASAARRNGLCIQRFSTGNPLSEKQMISSRPPIHVLSYPAEIQSFELQFA
jgi:hypothetical protein